MQRRTLTTLLVWAPYVALSVIHITALAISSPIAPATKLTLMPLLALPVVVAASRIRPGTTIALILGALLFSWLGDGAGSFFAAAPELPLMLFFFGIAHLAYITLFWRYASLRPLPRWTLVYAAWWIAMLLILGPQIGPLIIGVAAYGVLLAGTAATAARCNRLVTVGGAFFLASDTILAFRLFTPDAMPHWTSPAVMLTYTLGQGLIVAGLLRTLTRKAVR